MSRKDIQHALDRLADKGLIAENRVVPLTLQMILESAQQHFHLAYYGSLLDKEIENVRAMDHSAKEAALLRMETFITDMEKTRRAHKEVLTTSDFPLALANVRLAAQRPAYTYPESDLPKFAAKRTAPNFKVLKGHRPGVIGHKFLPVRPESTNVEYTKFFTSDEGYSVANYELGLPFTWEAWINDELGDFTAAAADLGNVARRTRAMVLMDTILRSAPRIPLTDGEFGPTPDNLDQIAQYMSTQVNADGRRVGRRVSDLFVPTLWERKANASMASEILVATGGVSGPLALVTGRNPAYQLATTHVDDIIADLLSEYPERYTAKNISANDYIVMDGRSQPLELATLAGYEGGPKTFTRVPNVVEDDMEGDFENHTIAMKVSDNVGAGVRDPYAIAVAQGN